MSQLLRGLARSCRTFINAQCLHHWDASGDTSAELPNTPVFILGAPRCGSTLLSQVLIQSLDVGYFSNLHAHFYGSLSLVQRLVTTRSKSPDFDFNSEHGRTKGLFAPSENGEFWYRFFRRQPAYVRMTDIESSKGRALRRSMERFLRSCDRPIIVKNLYVVLRLEVLRTYLPEAKYIVLHRNLFDNAASILRGRLKEKGSFKEWWSVETPNKTYLLGRDPVSQVIGQIDAVYELIRAEEEARTSPVQNFLHVDYEELCRNPAGIVQTVCDFLPECRLGSNGVAGLPDRFTLAQQDRTTDPIFEALHRRIEGL